MKWLFSDTSTKEPKAQFRTKRAAIEYGKAKANGIFIVWKDKPAHAAAGFATKLKETMQ